MTVRLRTAMREHVRSMEFVEHIGVMRTRPGSAPLVAAVIDAAHFEEVAGTVAGDDTVMVVVRSRQAAHRLATRLREAVEGGSRPRPEAVSPGGVPVTQSKRCVLAYSGGLDTSVSIRWLQEHLGYEVVTCTADIGEAKDIDAVTDRALRTGAVAAYAVDARQLLIEEFCFPTLAAGALYEGAYPLATALARPLIAKILVDVARDEGAEAVAHGCTGKGNDQVRFDVATAALAPDLKVVAPVRDWDMGRPQEIDYARRHGIEVPVTEASPYSVDANIWQRSVEAGVLEDPWSRRWPTSSPGPPTLAKAPEDGVATTIAFEHGIPVLPRRRGPARRRAGDPTNAVAGAQGVGRVDHVENRLVGASESREIYEAPAAITLQVAHAALETLTLGRDVAHLERKLGDEWARLVDDGLWYGHLRNALAAFVAVTQEPVSGEVQLRLRRGVASLIGRRAPGSLYREELATYDRRQDTFDHSAARGFIELFGLPLRTQSRIQGALEDTGPLKLERTVNGGDGGRTPQSQVWAGRLPACIRAASRNTPAASPTTAASTPTTSRRRSPTPGRRAPPASSPP